ncbi:MAG: hemerythrin domain-containing protein [Gammaproteobacteria bacterium]|nr:hemerythrin domain-containing protein [Gammaproteobacteria bacterium]
MSASRLDIYKEVHKGVRKELFDLIVFAGSTEFDKLDSLKQLKDRFSRTYSLLETHAHSEDTYVEPMILNCDTVVAEKLSSMHKQLEHAFSQLQEMLVGIDADDDDAVWRGRMLYLELTRFVGEYLQHIADEEQLVMPLLWENFDDRALMDVSITIRANVPPPVMGDFLSCMIPAMNHSERVLMLSGMKQAAPAEVFNGVCKLSQTVLADEDWARLNSIVNEEAIS